MKRSLVILLTAVSISAMTAGTAFPAFAEATEAEAEENTDGSENAVDSELEDGVYGVEFDTDSSMFHVNEACNGRATLTVKDGKMTVHITLVSKNIEELKGIDIGNLTPMEALNTLYNLQNKIKNRW